MPLVRREVIQLCVLLLVFPVQHWLINRQPEQPRSAVAKELIHLWHGFLNSNYLTKLYNTLVEPKEIEQLKYDELEESPAKEVLEWKSKQSSVHTDTFASSNEPRYDRHKGIEFRIGDVVVHKTKGYRGVIVGWDYQAKAPADYLQEVYGSERTPTLDQPHYLIAIDTRDRPTPQFAYNQQDQLKVITNTRIFHPNLEHYFESYNRKRYAPRPWLQDIYPKD